MSGAYRDTGAAIERAEALEREVEELRAEVARLKAASTDRSRPNREPTRLPPDVEELENEVVNLRAENELLRGQSSEGSSAEIRATAVIAERDELRREVTRLQNQIVDLRARLHDRPAASSDNRDAVIKRLTEEREELERELREARDRYEAEPPASRDPKTFEDKVLAILNRLVK
jgi:chromosome segregation ATPase